MNETISLNDLSVFLMPFSFTLETDMQNVWDPDGGVISLDPDPKMANKNFPAGDASTFPVPLLGTLSLDLAGDFLLTADTAVEAGHVNAMLPTNSMRNTKSCHRIGRSSSDEAPR